MGNTSLGTIAPTIEYRTLPDSQNFVSTEASFEFSSFLQFSQANERSQTGL